MNRQEIIRHYQAHPQVPVLIVGGGVNGIATFRDLALQGVSVLLVEQNDFASGASAASSHMVHGGIRYLENGEFRLVNEALHERNRLLLNAPPLRQTLAHHHSAVQVVLRHLQRPLQVFGVERKTIGTRDHHHQVGADAVRLLRQLQA